MKGQIHTKCLLLLMYYFHHGSKCIKKTWEKIKWDKHSDNTRLLTFNTQHTDCRHCSPFFTYYCSPVQQEEMWITKKAWLKKKKKEEKHVPLKNRTNSHFRAVTKRFLFLLNIMFIEVNNSLLVHLLISEVLSKLQETAVKLESYNVWNVLIWVQNTQRCKTSSCYTEFVSFLICL